MLTEAMECILTKFEEIKIKDFEENDLKKNIVIIGGGSSLGYELINDLKDESYRFIVVTSKTELKFNRDNISVISSDLRNTSEVNRVSVIIKSQFSKINVIFFNIGGGLGLTENFIKFTDLQRLMWYNLGVVQEFNRKLFSNFCENTRIVCVGSVATKQMTASLGYTISKTALETYVRLMSKQFIKKNIHIIAVSLGAFYIEDNAMSRLKENKIEIYEQYIKERLPRKKMGSKDEILPFLKFLFFEDVGMFSGSVISMDGGEKLAI